MKQSTRTVSKWLTAAIGLQSLLLALNPQAAFAANKIDSITKDHLVISQIHADSLDTDKEYVEIYNPTSTDIPVSDYDLAVFKDILNPTVQTPLNIAWPVDGSIKAGGYYLVTAKDATIVTKDAEYSNNDHSLLANDAVALIKKSTTAIVDLVGWDSVNPTNCETECAIHGTGILDPVFIRQPDNNEGNGIDTDNNKNDFFSVEYSDATPRNSSSASQFAVAPVINSVTPVESSYTNTTSVQVTANITEEHFDSAELTLDGTDVAFNTYNGNTITFVASAPLTDGMHTAHLIVTDKAGFAAEKTWDFTIDTINPTVRIEYQNTEVTSSGAFANMKLIYNDDRSGVKEMQISTTGIFDPNNWTTAANPVRVQLPSKEGKHSVYVAVRDNAGNVSSIDSVSLDIKAPAIDAPEYALTSTTGNQVIITWKSVTDAVKYVIKYTDGTSVTLVETSDKYAVVTLPDTSKIYHFEVAAVNIYGATSSYTAAYTPEQSPAKAQFMPATTAPVTVTNAVAETTTVNENDGQITQRTAPTKYTTNPTPTATISPAPTPSASPEGEIKSDSDNRTTDWTKIIVALSILIIAAGVATGGWYLYQWWTTQPKDNGKGKKGGRW